MVRLLIMLCCFWCASVQAYKVEPMSMDMRPIGKYAQTTLRIDNTSPAPLTVELLSYSMTMDAFGVETIAPADEDLLVIPMTAVIPPGRSQTVMIRYLGDPAISESKAYRVAVKQVRVAGNHSDSAQMGLLLQFNTLINVTPENSESRLAIKSIEQNNNDWLIEVENSGNSYGRLSRTRWLISDGSRDIRLSGKQVGQLLAGTLVLPNSTRFFKMKPLDNFNPDSLSIQILKE